MHGSLLSSCARAATAAEARYRLDRPIGGRAALVVALDDAAAELVERVAELPWQGARFVRAQGTVPEELAASDVAIMVGTAAADAESASTIAAACAERGIMTAGLILGARADEMMHEPVTVDEAQVVAEHERALRCRLDLDAPTVFFGDRLPPRTRRLLEGRFPLLVRVPVPGDVEVGDVGDPHGGQSLPTAAAQRTRLYQRETGPSNRSAQDGSPSRSGTTGEATGRRTCSVGYRSSRSRQPSPPARNRLSSAPASSV
jgi:hypothetical protein